MQGGRAVAIIPVFIPHAGCPHQCVFCNQKTISGQQTASSRGVEQQLERYLQWIKPGPSNEAAFTAARLQVCRPTCRQNFSDL